MSTVNIKPQPGAELNIAKTEAEIAAKHASESAAHAGEAAKIAAQDAARNVQATVAETERAVEQKWEETKPALKATFNQGKDPELLAAEEERRKLENM